MKLITPPEYYQASQRIRDRICNGTGASGTPPWMTRILDNLDGWGIDLAEASNRHDWQYHWGFRWWHKIRADLVFLINMALISFYAIFQKPLSRAVGALLLFPLRILRASIYFLAVFLFGWGPFYYGKPIKKRG